PGLIPQPSRIMSMTGPAIWAALCRRLGTSTSGSFVDNARNARLHRPHEMAQSVAGAFLSPRVRRAWCSLFSTLGHSEAFRNYFIYRTGTFSRPFGSDSRLCRRRGWAPKPRFDDSSGFIDQLLERF